MSTGSVGRKGGLHALKEFISGSPHKVDSPSSLSKEKSLKKKQEMSSLKKKSLERQPLSNIFPAQQSPSTPSTDKGEPALDFMPSPGTPILSTRRGSVKPLVNKAPRGILMLRVPEVNTQFKPSKEQKVIYVMVTVLGCALTTSYRRYAPNVSFEEIFEFPVSGDFIIKLEVFVQTEKRGDSNNFEMPESLGVLTFERLSVVQLEKLTGVYYLQKDNVDTKNSITLNLAIKIDQGEEVDRTKLPDAEFTGILSRQVPTGNTYSWIISDCELRGRVLTFYSDSKKIKSLEIDPKSKAKKPETEELEEVFPYYCFQVSVNKKPVYLVAQSKEMMNEWMSKINKAVSSPF